MEVENGQPQCSYEDGVGARNLVNVGHKKIWSEGSGWDSNTDDVGLTVPAQYRNQSKEFRFLAVNSGISVAAGRVSVSGGTFCVT